MTILKKINIFAVRKSYNSTAIMQFFRNYTIRRSFSHSSSSAIGGFRKLERATLFLFIFLTVIFLLMRKPVKNCDAANNSTCTTTSVHDTNAPAYCSFLEAWEELTRYADTSENIPETIKQNLMQLTATVVGLHQQNESLVELSTADAIDWLNNLYNFFNQLSKSNGKSN